MIISSTMPALLR